VTAVATSASSSNTSEFSACRFVDGPPPTPIPVINTSNAGIGSLRQAILDANASPGSSVITFAIPGPGPHTIAISSGLPSLTGSLVIDGTSQPGYSGSPVIVLDGSDAGVGTGLELSGPANHVRGLSIVGFSTAGIAVTNSDNTIRGNYLGVLPDGVTAKGNGYGVTITTAGNNIIGGTTAQDRNVLSGNTNDGIWIISGASLNTIQGNYIGTDALGSLDVGNEGHGVLVTAGVGVTIGGTVAGSGNVISGNVYGVSVHDTIGTAIVGNLIGVNAGGTAALGNDTHGLHITASSGGTTVQENVISGNLGNGVILDGSSSGASIRGNFIGTLSDRTTLLGNQHSGIRVVDSYQNTVGLTIDDFGAENVIAGNGFFGIQIASGHGNTILGNAIFSNGLLGIELGDDWVTPNDAGDSDGGANDLQNFPVLTSLVGDSDTTEINGTLHSTPGTTFRIDFYQSSDCDSSGHGEGSFLFGSRTVTTNSDGNAAVLAFFEGPQMVGRPITVTATDSTSLNTSEFSACKLVEGLN
jgi:parallel beta-helix repeat protein